MYMLSQLVIFDSVRGSLTHYCYVTFRNSGLPDLWYLEKLSRMSCHQLFTRMQLTRCVSSEQYYSADPHKLFSGVVACAADVRT